jgi:hypothetical protein
MECSIKLTELLNTLKQGVGEENFFIYKTLNK